VHAFLSSRVRFTDLDTLKPMTGRTRRKKRRWVLALVIGAVVIAVLAGALIVVIRGKQDALTTTMYDGRLESADYWTDTPQILSAGFGFDGIIAVAGDDAASTQAVGGAYDTSLACAADPTDADRSSVAPARGLDPVLRLAPGKTLSNVDGTPVVFSWPVRTDTLDPGQFQFTLNTGEVLTPDAITMTPNFELNERNTVVMFSDLGNRGKASDPSARFPVKLDIIRSASGADLMLAGPHGDVAATGLSWSTTKTPYDLGPTLVGAKLNRVDAVPQGEGGVTGAGAKTLPNDEQALYGDASNFRLRMLTSGGFSPDGVRGIRPDDFETFFRLHATGPDGSDVAISKVGTPYAVRGGTLTVIGLSDTGQKEDSASGVTYDDCYADDRDNYIDIMITGDDAAARSITSLEIPAKAGGYHDLYNPGGPGRTPFSNWTYTAPGPASTTPVTIALDDPMRVSR